MVWMSKRGLTEPVDSLFSFITTLPNWKEKLMEAPNHVYFQYAFKKILLVLFDSDLNAPPSKRSKRIYPASVNREEATNSKEGDK